MKLMEKGKRIWVLLVGLFVFSQTLLADTLNFYRRTENGSLSAISIAQKPFAFLSPVKQNSVVADVAFQINTDIAASDKDDQPEFYNGYVKCKKKYKRIQHFSSKIKAPVKILTAIIPASEKGTYTKPYFLSHLHHFLFRLTPF